MRAARTLKLVLIAAMAFAALALSPTSASAVTVTDEKTGTLCPALGSVGGCAFHAYGEYLNQGHVFGIESTATDCNIEMTGRFDAGGNGKVDSVALTDHAPADDCRYTPCNLPWTITIGGSTGAYTLTVPVCWTDTGGTDHTCVVTLPVSESGHSYSSSFHVRASSSIQAPGCELEGQLSFEGTALELS
jgi:hypothetical protein